MPRQFAVFEAREHPHRRLNGGFRSLPRWHALCSMSGMKSVSWMLLMAATGREAPARGTGTRAAAQVVRRRDGALLLAPIDVRLAQAAKQRAPAIY